MGFSKSFQNTKAMKIKLIQHYLNKIQLNTRKIDSKGISIFFQALSKHQGYKNTNHFQNKICFSFSYLSYHKRF